MCHIDQTNEHSDEPVIISLLLLNTWSLSRKFESRRAIAKLWPRYLILFISVLKQQTGTMVVSFAAVFRLLEKDLNCILNHEMRAEFFPLFSDGIKAAYTSFVPPYTLPKVLLIYILLYIYSQRFSFIFSFLFLLLPLLP